MAHDPFHHLHDEGYAAPYQQPLATWRDLVFAGGRLREPLAGTWAFTLDPFEETLRERWFESEPSAPRTWRTPPNYDDGAWQSIPVPACWNLAQARWYHYEGAALYTRTFEYAARSPGERIVLRVGAANYEARVFLNGKFLATHRGGSTPFCVELTRALRTGSNRLQIHVDNSRRPERVPMRHFDWFNYGGLYREVDLVRLPPVFIRDFGCAVVPDTGGRRIRLDLEISDPVDGSAEVSIRELGLAVTLKVTGGRACVEIDAQPRLWSPGSPQRYAVTARFGADLVGDLVGFREVRVRGTEILLNGQSIYLAGICVHEDDEQLGKVSTDDDVRRRIRHARELGCNTLRLAHYPHHEHVAMLADEAGMLLWEEIPVYWAIDFANPSTLEDAQNQLLEMIRRDRNRASVIVWGVGNENADTEARFRFMRTLAVEARTADPTRLVSAACLIDREHFRIEDRLAAHLDVVGINEYFGWYEPGLDNLRKLLANSRPDRPVVISETGADALAGHHGSETELFTEECQAAILRGQGEILDTVPWIRGLFPWLLYDFRSERRQTAFQRGYNRKGLIAEDKSTRKLGAAALAAHYARRTRP